MGNGLLEVIQELQAIQAETAKGISFLYDAECKLADAESALERAMALAYLNNQGTIADKTAIAKLESADLKLQADLARAEFNRIKTKLKHLEMAQMSLQTQARLLETELKTLR